LLRQRNLHKWVSDQHSAAAGGGFTFAFVYLLRPREQTH